MMLTLATSFIPSTIAQSVAASASEGATVTTFDIDALVPIIAIIMGCLIAIIAIVCSVVANGQREKTRREIAAYIAEGTITPDDGERMMRAASMKPKS